MKRTKHLVDTSGKNTLAEQLSSYLRSTHREIQTVYLFGSFAVDNAFSDIDLGVLLQEDINSPLTYELNLETEFEKIVRKPVDVRILNHAPPAFCREVIKCRRVLLDRNPTARADFEGLTVKRYADFTFYRRRYLEDIIYAPI